MKAIYLGYAMILSQHKPPSAWCATTLSKLIDEELDSQGDSGFAQLDEAGIIEQPLVAALREIVEKFMPEVIVRPSVYPAILVIGDGDPRVNLLWLATLRALWDMAPEPITLKRLFDRFPHGLPSYDTYARLWAAQHIAHTNALERPEAWA